MKETSKYHIGRGSALSGGSECVMAIPATFAIDRNGTIALGFADVDYRKRGAN